LFFLFFFKKNLRLSIAAADCLETKPVDRCSFDFRTVTLWKNDFEWIFEFFENLIVDQKKRVDQNVLDEIKDGDAVANGTKESIAIGCKE